jgi:hypothetical protein
MVWKDCTNYSRNDEERKPTSFELKFSSDLRITITNGHLYYKGQWIMHCFNVGIDTYPLNVKTQEEAQEKAIATVRAKVKRWHDALSSTR